VPLGTDSGTLPGFRCIGEIDETNSRNLLALGKYFDMEEF